MATLQQFANRMRLHAQAVDRNSREAVKTVANVVGPTVVVATPIDTSRARLNWQASVGAPLNGVLFAPPSRPSGGADGSSTAITAIRSATGAYSGQSGGIWIVNNLNYIGALNDGSSAQAPADFVAKAVLSAVNAISNIRLIP